MKKFRKKIKPRSSKRLFENTAKMTHSRNLQATPMRGGFRL